MTQRNRETLKNYFQGGQRPTEDHFADLIDSTLNLTDEGFRKTVEHGEEITAATGHDALISFFRDHNPQVPTWSIEFAPGSENLLVRCDPSRSPEGSEEEAPPGLEAHPLLFLDRGGRVAIGHETPQAELDVAGTLRCQGRAGALPLPEPPLAANGEWHDLSCDLVGCQAFEILAGVGHPSTGRFALLHAIALNTYNPNLGLFEFLNRRRGIRCTHATYSRRCDRIQLRWAGSSGRNAVYRLQIRTGSDYGEGILIQPQLTRLWDNPHMAQATR